MGEYVTPKQGATRATRGYSQKPYDKVNRVAKTGEEAPITPDPRVVILDKLKHLVKTERDVLGLVITNYIDLFCTTARECFPVQGRAFLR